MPWFFTDQFTWSGCPLAAGPVVVSAVTVRSAYGCVMTSTTFGGCAALFASEPFSNTSVFASVITKRWYRLLIPPGSRICSERE